LPNAVAVSAVKRTSYSRNSLLASGRRREQHSTRPSGMADFTSHTGKRMRALDEFEGAMGFIGRFSTKQWATVSIFRLACSADQPAISGGARMGPDRSHSSLKRAKTSNPKNDGKNHLQHTTIRSAARAGANRDSRWYTSQGTASAHALRTPEMRVLRLRLYRSWLRRRRAAPPSDKCI
jgi:hypothetical protein